MRHSALYTLVFAAAVCLVCSIIVSASAVALRPQQERNMVLDRQANVLVVAGLATTDEVKDHQRVQELFDKYVRPRLIDMKTGEYAENEEELLKTYNMQEAMQNPETSIAAPPNPAQVQRTPTIGLLYEVVDDSDNVQKLVIPVQGKGLWSTLYGYLALKNDVNTIEGLTFYQQAETPGLGGEVENPKWKALWPGRLAFGDDWKVLIHVIKGKAGPPSEDPYAIDGLSGATITSRGVTNLLDFWLGPEGYLPYLQRFSGGELPQMQTT